MKTRKRSVPLDMLSVEKKGKWLQISTHREQIVLSFGPEGCCGLDLRYDFEAFLQLLHRLHDQQTNQPSPNHL